MDYPQTILAWAMLYRKLNWSVVPVGLGTKFPLIEWAPYQQRLPTAEEVYEWFEGGGVGIGVVTGKVSNLTVIDNDSYKPQAVKLKLTTPLEAISGKGGRHYFFAYNPKIQTFKNEEKCVDARSEGGFIVLTPTVHPDTGKEYMWLGDPPTKEIIKNLPQAPDALEGYNSSLPGQSLDLDKLIGTAEGGRDENLYRFACRLIAHEGLSPEAAYQDLLILNATFKPPLPESAVREKLASALKWKSGKLREQKEEKEDEVEPFVFEPSWIEDLNSETERFDWIWEDYWAKGHVTLLTAYQKAGKSTMITHLLKSMQEEGGSFAGRKVHPKKVLYFSEERRPKWAERRDELNLNGFQIICRPLRQRLTYQQWVDHLVKTAEYCIHEGIDAVVYDPISYFWGVDDENNASQMNKVLTPLSNLTEKNIGVLLIHHSRKEGGGQNVSFRGSTAIGASVDVMIEFSRLPGEEGDNDHPHTNKRLLKGEGRFDNIPERVVIELTSEGYVALGESLREIRQEEKEQQIEQNILDILEGLGEPVTPAEILETWDVEIMGKIPHRNTLSKYLAKLKLTGQIILTNKRIAQPQGGFLKTPFFSLPDMIHAQNSPDTQDEITMESPPKLL